MTRGRRFFQNAARRSRAPRPSAVRSSPARLVSSGRRGAGASRVFSSTWRFQTVFHFLPSVLLSPWISFVACRRGRGGWRFHSEGLADSGALSTQQARDPGEASTLRLETMSWFHARPRSFRKWVGICPSANRPTGSWSNPGYAESHEIFFQGNQ